MSGMPPTMEFNRPLGETPQFKVGRRSTKQLEKLSKSVAENRKKTEALRSERRQTPLLNAEREARDVKNKNQFNKPLLALPAGRGPNPDSVLTIRPTSGPGEARMFSSDDHLITLGFKPGQNPTRGQIEKRFRTIARGTHPESPIVQSEKSPVDRQRKIERFKAVSSAYSALTQTPMQMRTPSTGDGFSVRNDLRKDIFTRASQEHTEEHDS